MVAMGQVWRRVKRGEPKVVGKIVRVWRRDRQVVVQLQDGERLTVDFTELRKHWRLGDGS
jgi:hypothetical protein